MKRTKSKKKIAKIICDYDVSKGVDDVLMDTGEKELWRKYKNSKCLRIRDALIRRYYPFVRNLVGNYIKKKKVDNWATDYEDLIGYGTFGLINAIGKYDYDAGTKFSTFAFLYIYGEICSGVRRFCPFPRIVYRKIKMISRVEERFLSKG